MLLSRGGVSNDFLQQVTNRKASEAPFDDRAFGVDVIIHEIFT